MKLVEDAFDGIAAGDPPRNAEDRAMLRLLRALEARGYRFVTPTPATHARVIRRPTRQVGRSLTDLLGWNIPCRRDDIPGDIIALLTAANAIGEGERGDAWLRARIRVSSLRGDLYVHSSYPTDAEDSVFFGPDSYRFADLIAAELTGRPAKPGSVIVDIGAGAGVGGITAAKLHPDAELHLTDVNDATLRLSAVNAAAAGVRAHLRKGSGLAALRSPVDVALINPPYIIDEASRTYRDGGGMHGAELAIELTSEAVARLAPSGRLILYTGSAIVNGHDQLHAALEKLAGAERLRLSYREIDPDIFGEELENAAYEEVDRIALVAAVLTRPSGADD